MTQYFKYIFLFLAIVCILPSCEKDDKEEAVMSNSVRISAFSLVADTAVLDNLENVFFTIDLDKGLIYNADSLPVGTDVSKLKVKIATDSAQYVNIETPDSTYNYLDYSKKAIDFSAPVNIEVRSRSGLFKKRYEVKVNVHKTNPDRLFWGILQYSTMPGNDSGALADQHTLKFNGLIYSFMQRGEGYVLATAANPGDEWNITQLSLPMTPQLKSIRCTDTGFYMLDTEGVLYASADGVEWESTGAGYSAIIGGYNGLLLTLIQEEGAYYHDIYPRPEGYTPRPVAEDFPVSGFSEMLTYNSSWLTDPQGMIVGGRTASGQLTGAMWGYDGTTWAMLNNTIPAREGAALFQYVTFFVDDYWITSEKITWFVFGGFSETRALNDVWISNNYGVSWQKADINLQLPAYVTPGGYASVIINDEPISTTYDSWHSLDTSVPQGFRCVPMYSTPSQDLVPYIYIFGGETFNGLMYNQVWRGIINRLRFEPIP